jgi:hypothetical protein
MRPYKNYNQEKQETKMNRVMIHQEKRHYYRAHLQPDLFGLWRLTHSWGRLDSQHGQVRTEMVDKPNKGEQILAGINERRSINGYRLTQSGGR